VNRPCLGCGELVNRGSYCRPCELSGPRRAYKDPAYLAAKVAMLPGTCWLCGLAGADTLDHVTPLDEGGDNDWSNLRPAHRPCNSGRRP
jgi:5-methylcytosine-specific restriction endonuclease McrA